MPSEVIRVASLRPNNRPIDPDVKIPAAVTRAREASEAAQRAAYPDQTPPKDPTPPADPDNIKIVEPPPQDAPIPPVVTPKGNETPPTPTPTPTPTPPAEDSWEHKCKSAEGRVRQLLTQNTQLIERLGALEAMMQDLKNAPPPAAPAPPAPSRLVTPEEENEFGTEMLDVMARRARETLSPELVALKEQLTAMEAKLTGTVQTVTRTARQDMLANLDTTMSDWRRINELQEFKAWLALPDPYFGVNRHSELLKAFAANDTSRVKNFFKGFISELAVTDPAPDLTLPTTPAAQPAKPGLESLAAPGRARTPAAVTPPDEKQIITTDDVNAFYDAKRRGAYAGREEEFIKLEKELFKAQREGRVRAV
jgi:hypothetical protein